MKRCCYVWRKGLTCGQEPTIDELPLWHLEPIAALLPQVGTPIVALIKQRSPCVTNRPGLVWDEPNAAPVIFSHHFLSNLLTFSGFYHHHTSQFFGHILCMTKSGEITDRFFLQISDFFTVNFLLFPSADWNGRNLELQLLLREKDPPSFHLFFQPLHTTLVLLNKLQYIYVCICIKDFTEGTLLQSIVSSKILRMSGTI